uniref:Uncharacterized protein n=1 Tax=Oryza sativa subsp. japonica TaxID=39947 RepID=Q67WK7_ORYSJ|nr:hypothetical protein [Oryza sativa Japonica Group]BAD37462.1 hypothetical protein [Oryza sativa Japonica Group]
MSNLNRNTQALAGTEHKTLKETKKRKTKSRESIRILPGGGSKERKKALLCLILVLLLRGEWIWCRAATPASTYSEAMRRGGNGQGGGGGGRAGSEKGGETGDSYKDLFFFWTEARRTRGRKEDRLGEERREGEPSTPPICCCLDFTGICVEGEEGSSQAGQRRRVFFYSASISNWIYAAFF